MTNDNSGAHAGGVLVHPTALVSSTSIGSGTRIWAFCNVLAGAVIGEDCQICDRVFVEDGAVIGDSVTIKCGVSVWKGVTLETGAFVGPGVMFANDPHPRSGCQLASHPATVVGRFASLGSGAVVLPGVRIGAYAMVGAGCVVTRDVADFECVVGNPGRPIGWVCVCGDRLEVDETRGTCRSNCGRTYDIEENGPVLALGSPDPRPRPDR